MVSRDDWKALQAAAQELEDRAKGTGPEAPEPGRLPRWSSGQKTTGEVLADKDDESANGVDTASVEESTGEALAAVRLRLKSLKVEQRSQDLKLRKSLARWATAFVAAQLLCANVFFGWYLFHNSENPDTAIMVAWLSATVVEVIGILWVIARSLFPYRDRANLHTPVKDQKV